MQLPSNGHAEIVGEYSDADIQSEKKWLRITQTMVLNITWLTNAVGPAGGLTSLKRAISNASGLMTMLLREDQLGQIPDKVRPVYQELMTAFTNAQNKASQMEQSGETGPSGSTQIYTDSPTPILITETKIKEAIQKGEAPKLFKEQASYMEEETEGGIGLMPILLVGGALVGGFLILRGN